MTRSWNVPWNLGLRSIHLQAIIQSRSDDGELDYGDRKQIRFSALAMILSTVPNLLELYMRILSVGRSRL